MLSPTWAFGAPAVAAMGMASLILLLACLHETGILPGSGPFGASWTIVAGFLFTSGHFAAIMALVTHLHGVQKGYRILRPSLRRIGALLTLETMLLSGLVLIGLSLSMMVLIGYRWGMAGFAAPSTTLPLVVAAATGAAGLQTVFGAFVLAIIGGHETRFVGRGEAGMRVVPDKADRLDEAA